MGDFWDIIWEMKGEFGISGRGKPLGDLFGQARPISGLQSVVHWGVAGGLWGDRWRGKQWTRC